MTPSQEQRTIVTRLREKVTGLKKVSAAIPDLDAAIEKEGKTRPAAIVMYGGDRPESSDAGNGRSIQCDRYWFVVLVADVLNEAQQEAALDRSDEIIAALIGWSPDDASKPFHFAGRSMVWRKESRAAYEIRVKTKVSHKAL